MKRHLAPLMLPNEQNDGQCQMYYTVRPLRYATRCTRNAVAYIERGSGRFVRQVKVCAECAAHDAASLTPQRKD